MKHPNSAKPNDHESVVGTDNIASAGSKILILTHQTSGTEPLRKVIEHTWEIPVVVATDAEHAFTLFHRVHPDLIIVDHAEAAHFLWQVRQDRGPDAFLPVLVLVGDESAKMKQEAMVAGATDFLAKPVDVSEAMLRIHNLLSLREARLQSMARPSPAQSRAAAQPEEIGSRTPQLRGRADLPVAPDRLHVLGTMASGIAHDFNNLLTVIVGFAEQLLQEGESLSREERWGLLGSIVAAGRDGASMVGRLREFHFPTADDQAYQEVNLNHLVEQGIALTKPKWRAESRVRGADITIRQELSDLPSIHGHPAQLREILTNLIFNAVDAMPHGGTITVRTSLEGGKVVLAVADTGTGMTERVRRRCLEPFFTTKGDHGTGMGLPMVQEIAERHGAHLEVESEIGRGTQFRLRFKEYTRKVRAESVATPDTVDSLNVLVVDDEPLVGDLVARILAGEGHRVRVTCDPHEALRAATAEFFDLVITDQSMPLMNGERLATAIKASCSATRVLLVTGFGVDGAIPNGVDLVLGKPFTGEALRRGIAEVFAVPPGARTAPGLALASTH